jgi:cyclic-di-GMP phosphodiesterase TipF (flagellum assembly factor)
MRLGAIFVAFCMLLIAGSGGAVAAFVFGFNAAGAMVVAIALFTALALYNLVSTRLRAPAAAGREVDDLANGIADLARQVGELGRRLAGLEARVENSLNKARPAAPDLLVGEFEEVGMLVRQLADTVAAHETRIAELARPAPPPPPPPPRQQIEPVFATESPPLQGLPAAAPVSPPAVAEKPAPAAGTATESAQEAMLAAARSAIAGGRVELYLQPIVTLPQRKVRYYEALSRLRSDRGEVVAAADFIPLAERAGLAPQVDNLVVFRSVQVVRRLLAKNREIGLFCNVSTATLADAAVFGQLLEFLDANRAIAPSLVFEFTQSAMRAAGGIENESLSVLAGRGFRFSLDNLADLRIEPRALATAGFRFVKVPGRLLLDHGEGGAVDIHPADLADLLARYGIELIAEKIESDAMVADLLDYDVKYGQGFLFSPPRPVRAEALQGAAEHGGLVETPAPPAAPVPDAGKPSRSTGLAQLARRV